MRTTTKSKHPFSHILSLRDFRLLFVGASTSLLGDQFALIAIPWLVLKLTGDPLALGFVLALVGIPRAAFMLLGGVFTDRFSPACLIMLISDIIRFILTGLMAFVVFTEIVQLWMLYAFGLGFGLVARFRCPSRKQYRAETGQRAGFAGRQLDHNGHHSTGRVYWPNRCRYFDRWYFQLIHRYWPGFHDRCTSSPSRQFVSG